LEDKKSRTLEIVLAIIGGIFGLLGGVFALIFSAFAPSVGVLGVSAILASIVGLIGGIYVSSNAKYGGNHPNHQCNMAINQHLSIWVS
jgi:disulfide bond formation protein DsbB